ncbi:MAG: hypothetical protein AUI45_05695 [Acidobacteria bacterium 13_1_40CM_2_56_11]|nr:MAG: hypothetical protein AUI45_05695 [Acidobacteria bacterium 13_1_40CM_2_56_11]
MNSLIDRRYIAAGVTQGSSLRFYQWRTSTYGERPLDTSAAPGFELVNNLKGPPVVDDWAGGNLTR